MQEEHDRSNDKLIVEAPQLGQLTQGTIFTCASAARYPENRVYGLTITARCDIANEKYPVLNYLPIVLLDDWMHCDGAEIAHSQMESQKKGEFRRALKEKDVAESILLSVDYDVVAQSFFRDPATTAKDQKLAERVEGLAEDLIGLRLFSISRKGDTDWLHNKFPQAFSKIASDLIRHKVNGYYFLENIDPNGLRDGYVILLREVGSLSPEEARLLPSGLHKEELPYPIGEFTSFSFHADEFAMPIGQVRSPAIERILQTFSIMFGRIGVEDPPEELLERICNRPYINMGG